MMPTRRSSLLVRAGSAAALVLALAGCTPGGQFDPTTLFDNDMFDTKKKLKGEREPVFPNGVPGATTGVPPDLVKGYQPPPDQAADADCAPTPPRKQAGKNQSRSRHAKPKVARAPAQPAATATTHQYRSEPPIRPRRLRRKAAPPPQQSQQSPCPPPPQTAPAQQANPTVQSRWPDPPKPGTSAQ